jgi:ABC-type transport system involved in multi-copper enzyme maturation permease subunit
MRYAFAGSLALAFGLQLVLVGEAVSIQQTESFGSLAQLIPTFIGQRLGGNAMLLASFKGTVMLGYFHPVLLVVIPAIAMYAATEPAYEVESGIVDLVLARSMPRWLVLTRSLVLSVVYALAAVTVMAAGTMTGAWLFNGARFDLPSPGLMARLLLHVFAVSACFASFGLLVGAGSRRRSAAFTTGVLVAVLAYLLDFLALGWPLMARVSWLSPYAYYHAMYIAQGTANEPREYAILFGAAGLLAAAAYLRFQRRDL